MQKCKLEKQSFMQGILALIFSQVLIKALGLIYKLYITNLDGFGDSGNAIYGGGFQIYACILTLTSVGVPGAISKLISEKVVLGDEKGADRILKISCITFALMGLIGTLILFLGANYISNYWLQIPEAELTLVALSPAVFFVSISSVFRGYFNGRQDLKATANSQTIEQIFKTIITIIIVGIISIISKTNTTIMAAGANLATTFSAMISFAYIFSYYKTRQKNINRKIRLSTYKKEERIKTILRNILIVAVPMSLSAAILSLNKSIDSITVVRLLKGFMSDEQAKIQYGMLSGKVDTLITLPLSFNMAFSIALIPAIAAAKAICDNETINKKISMSLLITMLIGLPCTVGLIIFAQPILNLLFPNANSGAIILQISSIMIIFLTLEQTVYGALQGLGKIFIPTIALIFGVISKLIINLLLIGNPHIGVLGASIGTVVCHIISFTISFHILRKKIKLNLRYKNFVVKPIIATLMMSITLLYTYKILVTIVTDKISTIISLMVAIIMYILAILVLRIFEKEEIYMLPGGQKLYNILKILKIY